MGHAVKCKNRHVDHMIGEAQLNCLVHGPGNLL